MIAEKGTKTSIGMVMISRQIFILGQKGLGGALMREAVLAVPLLAVMALATPAWAEGSNCYEQIGCPHKDRFTQKMLRSLSCQILWDVRNTIYKQNGYCFTTNRSIEAFGNDGCRFKTVAEAPLNAMEKANVVALQRAEKRKGCRPGGS